MPMMFARFMLVFFYFRVRTAGQRPVLPRFLCSRRRTIRGSTPEPSLITRSLGMKVSLHLGVVVWYIRSDCCVSSYRSVPKQSIRGSDVSWQMWNGMANSLLASSVSLPLIDSTVSFGSFIQYYFAYVVICFLSTQLIEMPKLQCHCSIGFGTPSPTRQLQCIRQLNIEEEAGNHAGRG